MAKVVAIVVVALLTISKCSAFTCLNKKGVTVNDAFGNNADLKVPAATTVEVIQQCNDNYVGRSYIVRTSGVLFQAERVWTVGPICGPIKVKVSSNKAYIKAPSNLEYPVANQYIKRLSEEFGDSGLCDGCNTSPAPEYTVVLPVPGLALSGTQYAWPKKYMDYPFFDNFKDTNCTEYYSVGWNQNNVVTSRPSVKLASFGSGFYMVPPVGDPGINYRQATILFDLPGTMPYLFGWISATSNQNADTSVPAHNVTSYTLGTPVYCNKGNKVNLVGIITPDLIGNLNRVVSNACMFKGIGGYQVPNSCCQGCPVAAKGVIDLYVEDTNTDEFMPLVVSCPSCTYNK